MKILTHIANKYLSDKGTTTGHRHGFTEIYDSYFSFYRNKNINLLEIGINDGASLNTWYEYFPYAKIYGLDIDNKSKFNNDKIYCYQLDQSKEKDLNKFVTQYKNIYFDIVIDDGSHHVEDQQLTLGYLFPVVQYGGLYIIEDLHTSLCDIGTKLYNRIIDIKTDRSNTTLNFLKNKPYNSIYLNYEQNLFLQNHIKNIEIYEYDNLSTGQQYKNKSITSIIRKVV